MHYCAEKQMQSHRVALPPVKPLEAVSFTSAWGKAISQKGISLWIKWRQGLCNLIPKSNQRSVDGPTDGCWPAFVCLFPSSVPGHPEALQGGCLLHRVHQPWRSPAFCVSQPWFRGSDHVQWNLSIWQGAKQGLSAGLTALPVTGGLQRSCTQLQQVPETPDGLYPSIHTCSAFLCWCLSSSTCT